MAEKNSFGALLESISDKVVLAALITAVSTYLFYGYTAYSKAFESIQAQSRSTTELAVRLRDSVLKRAAQVTNDVTRVFQSGKPLGEKEVGAAYLLAGEIDTDARILSSILDKSSKAARDLASSLRVNAFDFRQNGFPAEGTSTFERNVNELQTKFISEFNKEMGRAAAREFEDFFGAFNEQIPARFQPFNIVLICLSVLLLLVALMNLPQLLSRMRRPKPVQYYVVAIGKGQDSSYRAIFPDVSGIESVGITLDETIQKATDALFVVLANAMKQGAAPLPHPRSVDEILSDEKLKQDGMSVIAAIPVRFDGVTVS